MYTELMQEARDRIAGQEALWKETLPLHESVPNYTCVGLALMETTRKVSGSYNEREKVEDWLFTAFLEANGLSYESDALSFEAITEWNDEPERTLAEAVAALDAAVNYARTQEGT